MAAGAGTKPLSQPVPYNPSFEFVAEDERQTEQGLIETLTKIQTRVYEDSGEAFRGVHAKCHGIIVGELRVVDPLAPQYAQGMFSQPGRYPVVIRLSSIPGDVLDDEAGDVVQDSFLQAWQHLSELREAERFEAWLMQLVRRRAIDAHRRRATKLASCASSMPASSCRR